MSLFRPSRKFSEMLTAEQQYLAAQQQEQREASEAARAVQQQASQLGRERRAATQQRREQVVSAGTMRRRGRTVVLEGDWKLATGSLPVGEIPRVTRGKVGDLTLKDLHALATNHGPKCRCGMDR